MKKIFTIAAAIGIIASLCSCEKYLELKPDKKMATPSTLKDLQSLLDAGPVSDGYPNLIELAADNLFYSSDNYRSISDAEARNAYIWEPKTNYERDWNNMYDKVFLADVVLDNVGDASAGGLAEEQRNSIAGQGYFLRGYAFYHLLQAYAMPYEQGTAASALGIPLPLVADITQKTVRASMEESYRQTISDLRNAAALLPLSQPFPTRSTKAAAFAALSRVYMSMNEYKEAGAYADSALQLYNVLIDFNTINLNAAYPFELFNKEVIYHSNLAGTPSLFTSSRAEINPEVYTTYAMGDLRKTAWFSSNGKGGYSFKGNYNGGSALFNGIATNELYLNKSESLIREGEVPDGIRVLNTLLAKRYNRSFIPYREDLSQDEALTLVLAERRKELVFRGGLRWMDIRRLNSDPVRKITLSKTVNGQSYTLPPFDKRFAFLIPSSVISLSGIPQNER